MCLPVLVIAGYIIFVPRSLSFPRFHKFSVVFNLHCLTVSDFYTFLIKPNHIYTWSLICRLHRHCCLLLPFQRSDFTHSPFSIFTCLNTFPNYASSCLNSASTPSALLRFPFSQFRVATNQTPLAFTRRSAMRAAGLLCR